MLPVDEQWYVQQARYQMTYDELDAIVAFIRNHEWEEIPEGVKDYLDRWIDWLLNNL